MLPPPVSRVQGLAHYCRSARPIGVKRPAVVAKATGPGVGGQVSRGQRSRGRAQLLPASRGVRSTLRLHSISAE
ncbi:hypothetical protein LSTR_LSTR005715 [Laodelphax striatellus]|uniref:Uncharacterized protein n=1 Tax=Laodelphax striatellus TaxID=195883 RepID=A0A482XI68_LAOST|nr:hypothetical protein LSTR_LSTR005715 [Laodelphax striatellus]